MELQGISVKDARRQLVLYTDADVQTVSIADVNKEVMDTMKESNDALTWILVFFVIASSLAAVLVYRKKREE